MEGAIVLDHHLWWVFNPTVFFWSEVVMIWFYCTKLLCFQINSSLPEVRPSLELQSQFYQGQAGSPWPELASGDWLFSQCRSHHLGNSWKKIGDLNALDIFIHQISFRTFLHQSRLTSAKISEVKNPLTPAAAPPTASASQPVTRRKLSLFMDFQGAGGNHGEPQRQ